MSIDRLPAGTLEELRAEALARGRRPRLLGTFYVAEHVLRVMRAYGWTIVVGALGQPIIYLLGLAVGLAALIQAPITDAGGQEVPYLAFVAPALLMTAGIQVAMDELAYPVVDGFKWRRQYFGLSASPLTPGQIATGVLLGAGSRVLLALVGFFVFIWLFGVVWGDAFGFGSASAMLDPQTAWLVIPIGVLAAAAFGAPLMAFAASITEDKGQFALVQRFVFIPMFLFSATFYPLSALPWGLQWIGWISPLWHATELGRVVMYGLREPTWLTAVHVAYLVLLATVGYLLARRRFFLRLGT